MKIQLRKTIKNDLPLLRDWRNSKQFFEFSGQFKLLNMRDQIKWFNQINAKNSDKIIFTILNTMKEPIGVCGFTNIDYKNRSAEVAIILGNLNIHGQGYGSKSLKTLVDFGFNKMKLHRIEAQIFEFNKISFKLFKKLNFNHEATLRDSLWRNGRWWNTHVYSILTKEN